MSIAARCLHCAHRFSAPDTLAGKRVKCPKCAGAVPVPQLAAPPVDETLLELLDDKLAVHPAERHLAMAPATLPPPHITVSHVVRRPRLSQLVPYAPALELLGVFILSCGLFGLFANLVLKYESTWRDLGIVFLLGGGALFVLAQFVEYDGERFGRAIGVLFFVCVISASIGAGVEVASGRVTADSFKFWEPNPLAALLKEGDQLHDELTALLLQIDDLQSAQQHAEDLREFDSRISDFIDRGKALGEVKVKVSQQESEARLKRKAEKRSKLNTHFRAIAAKPNGTQVMAAITKNMPNLQKYNSAIFFHGEPDRFDLASMKSSPPESPRVHDIGSADSASSRQSNDQEIAAADERHKQFEREHEEEMNAARRTLEAASKQFGLPSAVPGTSASSSGKSSRSSNGRSFREQADWQFKFSRDAAGQAYLQAWAIAGSDEALKPQLQWCPALKRPAFSLYWGIGVSLEAMSEAPPPDDRWKNVRRPLEQRRQDVGFWQVNEFKKRTGDVGEWLAQGIQSRLDQRQFGDWGPEWERSKFDLRGLVLFEVGPLGWSLQKAREEGVDVLAMLHLHDKKSAAGVYTELQIHVLRVSDGKSLWHSDVLTDRKLKAERRKGKDPAADLVAAAFTFIDKELRLTNMPDVKPDSARKRAAKVSADLGIEPMTAVIEIRYYQVQGLLTADEAREAYEKKLGKAAAEALATGDESDREQVLATFFSK